MSFKIQESSSSNPGFNIERSPHTFSKIPYPRRFCKRGAAILKSKFLLGKVKGKPIYYLSLPKVSKETSSLCLGKVDSVLSGNSQKPLLSGKVRVISGLTLKKSL